MLVAGLDGCRDGWVCVRLDGAAWSADVHADIEEAWAALDGAELALIDMPIGLLDAGDEPRRCEQHARRLLGRRHVCVFTPPLRPALEAESYAAASALNRQLSGRAISRQAWGISGKIREIDDFLLRERRARALFREAHPELMFLVLNGGEPILENKKTAAGARRRLRLLAEHCEPRDVLQDMRRRYPKSRVADDDVLDALVNAVGARLCVERGCVSLPPDPAADGRGLVMEMVLPSTALTRGF